MKIIAECNKQELLSLIQEGKAVESGDVIPNLGKIKDAVEKEAWENLFKVFDDVSAADALKDEKAAHEDSDLDSSQDCGLTRAELREIGNLGYKCISSLLRHGENLEAIPGLVDSLQRLGAF